MFNPRVQADTLVDAVAKAFSAEGPLAGAIDRFKLREGQYEMAQAVAKVMQDGGVLAVEAGTGVGKTIAYLVPALLSGEKVLISTATKNLQDQLFMRDLPRAVAALGVPVRAALLKGRNSYLCAHRLSQAHINQPELPEKASELLRDVHRWSQQTVQGDIAEMADLQEYPDLVSLVTSTRENCLGGACPQIQNCHIAKARQRAMQAELVVVNHHLFFADLNVRSSGVAELLPSVRTVVFDEAHQLSDIGIQFLGRKWTTGQVKTLAQQVGSQNRGPARGFADWLGLAADLVRAADDLTTLLSEIVQTNRLIWVDTQPEGVHPDAWARTLQQVELMFSRAQETCLPFEEAFPSLRALAQRCQNLRDGLQAFIGPVDPDHVRWIEWGNGLSLHDAPLTIAPYMREVLGPVDPMCEPIKKSWIFTSATLGTDAELSWFVRACGLQSHQTLQVPSPFNFPQQAALYLPPIEPSAGEQAHSASVAAIVEKGARVLGGRTLVLTTTLRAMRAVAQALSDRFRGSRIEVLVQGQGSKRLLIERYLQSHNARARSANSDLPSGSVLVASASFWEGVDIPGEALQMLVIDKLPFAPPDDPLVQARARACELAGENSFSTLHLPNAAMALKQGAGRLIRSEADRGILVVCDQRLSTKGYGKKLLAALPPFRRIQDEAQWVQTLDALRAGPTGDQP